SVFFAFPAICLISIILAWILIKEKSNRQAPPPFRKYIRGLFSVCTLEGRCLLKSYLDAGPGLFTVFGILFSIAAVLEEKYHMDGVMKGLVLHIPLLVMVIASYITGSKIGKDLEKMKKLMVIGFALMTISYGLLVFFEKLIPFLAVLALSS